MADLEGTQIPVNSSNRMNPSWTGGVSAPQPQNQAGPVGPSVVANNSAAPPPTLASPQGVQTTNSSPLPPSAPPEVNPIVASPTMAGAGQNIGVNSVPSSVVGNVPANPIEVPSKTPLPPPVSSNPELSVTPPSRKPLNIPRRAILIGSIVTLGVGLIVFILWWFGIGFGAPRSADKALTQMAAALGAAGSYHASGDIEITWQFGDISSEAFFSNSRSANSELSLIAKAYAQTPSPTGTFEISPSASPSADAEDDSTDAPTFKNQSEPVTINLDFEFDQDQNQNSDIKLGFDLSKIDRTSGTAIPSTLPDLIEVEIKRVGDAVYLYAPALAVFMGTSQMPWLEFSASAFSSLQLTGITSPTINQLVTNGRRVGYEKIGPINTAHYTATITIPVGDREIGGQFDYWIGVGDHLPYKMELTGEDVNGTTVKTNFTMNNFGQIAAITPPNPDDIYSGDLGSLSLESLSESANLKARDAERKADLATIKAALELWKSDRGSYPQTGEVSTKTNDNKSTLSTLVDQGYLTKLPVDPSDPTYYYGYKSVDGSGYELWSILEDQSDTQGVARGSYFIYSISGGSVSSVSNSDDTGRLPTT